MKILVIPDLHGKSCWQDIDVLLYDKVVFLGDYVDSFTISDAEIINNLVKVIQQKEKYPERVVLLLGNHDIQYLYYPAYQCSGFRASYQKELTKIFFTNQALFLVAWQEGRYLFTHAGVTNAWHNAFISLPFRRSLIKDNYTVADLLNNVENSSERDILHQVSYLRGGKHKHGGITWADKREMESDYLLNYHQVVGHTPIFEVVSQGLPNSSITFVDVLDNRTYFHEIDTNRSPFPDL